ncbi:MAG TPA: hypothetical protein PLM56_06750 [Cyclobacteriaceae bacterium]|jgi:hypothetical protein|nr:hypothetical protein [Cytophagales bacterium]HRE67004.1 hypothetical protein [Cyclobacteriaceae bacterium]HRF33178.1 hypothetical protein [Cyclobacteriaceae bacterium]
MSTENQLSPKQSLDVITSMIQQAKGNTQKNSFYFLLWGCTIAVANLGVYIMLKFTQVENPYNMFLITLVSAAVSIVYGIRQNKKSTVSTHLDEIYKWVWMSFGATCFIFWIFGGKVGWQINPIITTLCAIPTFISGVLLKFKPLMFGGIVFWVSGAVIFLVDIETQFLLTSIAVIVCYIIPGYMLKRSE